MKQLKFMLAAATAIGLATAAQAEEQFKDTFDTRVVEGETVAIEAGTDAVDLPGYLFFPGENETSSDNESEVVGSGGNSGNALSVNTGVTPLLRDLDSSSEAGVSIAGGDTLYIDTMVQFTVTPNGDTVSKTDDDKLMIYLQETNIVGEASETIVQTNLMVKAAKYIAANPTPPARPATFTPTDVRVSGIDKVEAGEWYRLVVKSTLDSKNFVVFKIEMAKKGDDLASLKPAISLNPDDEYAFPSLQGIYDAKNNPKAKSLKYVGFAGEGKVDDLAFGTIETVTPVDFTLALGEGVSAVSYTVGEDTGSLPTTEGATSVALKGVAVVVSDIAYAPGYGAGTNLAGSYPATKDGTITIDAKKNASVKNDGTTTASGSDVGFADTVFATATGSTLEAVVAWTGSSRVSTDVVKSMKFFTTGASKGDPASTVGTPARAAEEAYLLGCSPAEVEAEKEEFVFPSFTTDMTPAQMKGAIEAAAAEAGKSYNGEVVIEGATTLSDENGKPNWATNHEKPAFYRARLIFK